MSATARAALAQENRETPYTERARYFDSGNAFAIKSPDVPRHIFLAERDRAFAPDTATGLIDLDLSGALDLAYPATTPLILARYARIRAGESLSTAFRSSGEIYYAIQGEGSTRGRHDHIEWKAGDAVFLPGGEAWTHSAQKDAVLWVVTNEPQLAFQGLEPPPRERRAGAPAHFLAERIDAQIEALHQKPAAEDMPGFAVVFSSESMEAKRNIHPTMTLAMNSLPAGEVQRPHHHNSIAVTLCVEGEGGYSITGGERTDWSPHAVFVTPPGAVHSHHNEGPALAKFLIVQDGGLYYHCRTMGFAYDT